MARVSQFQDLIETWGFCEDIVVNNYGDGYNNNDNNNNNVDKDDNKDNNNNKGISAVG